MIEIVYNIERIFCRLSIGALSPVRGMPASMIQEARKEKRLHRSRTSS